MKAMITNPNGYKCAPEGHTIVHFDVGSIVEGYIAKIALADGAAIEIQAVTNGDIEKKNDVHEASKNVLKKKTRKA